MKRLNRVLTLPVLTILLVLSVAASYATYRYADVRERGLIATRVEAVSARVSPDALGRLAGDKSDIENPAYDEVKDFLIKERKAHRDVRFFYVIGKADDGSLFFHADSEPNDSGDYSPPGQRYTEATPAMRAIFSQGGTQVEGPDRDRWGLWMAAYVPVLAATGETMLFGMDISAYRYFFNVMILPLAPLSLVILLGLMCVEKRRKV